MLRKHSRSLSVYLPWSRVPSFLFSHAGADKSDRLESSLSTCRFAPKAPLCDSRPEIAGRVVNRSDFSPSRFLSFQEVLLPPDLPRCLPRLWRSRDRFRQILLHRLSPFRLRALSGEFRGPLLFSRMRVFPCTLTVCLEAPDASGGDCNPAYGQAVRLTTPGGHSDDL